MTTTNNSLMRDRTPCPRWINFSDTFYNISRESSFTTAGGYYDKDYAKNAGEREYELNKKTFETMSEADKRNYQGNFVAIYEGEVKDQDQNESALIGRFFKRYGNVRVYINKVTNEEDTIVEILSPFGLMD